MKALLLIVVSLLISATSFAQTGASKADKKELPKTGSLSFSGAMGGSGDFGIEMPWGDSNEGAAPITGSVSRISPDYWQMKLFNNSEDTYSASVRVIQYNEMGAQTKTDSFSYTLKPGQNAERKVSAASRGVRGELRLENWKKIGDRKKEKSSAGPAAETSEQASGEE